MTAMIDYNAGNVFSVAAALRRLGEEVVLTDQADVILSADRVVFPGVGYADAAMKELERRGLVDVLTRVEVPFLGICLGMQLMCRHSQEGDVDMLSIVDAPVVRFERDVCRKIPQIGWNRVYGMDCPLFDGIRDGSWFFFDHAHGTGLCRPDGVLRLRVFQRDIQRAVLRCPVPSREEREGRIETACKLSLDGGMR